MFSTIISVSTINMPDNFWFYDKIRLLLQQAADSVVFDNSLGYAYPWDSSNVQPPAQSEFSVQTPSTAPTDTRSAAPTQTTWTVPGTDSSYWNQISSSYGKPINGSVSITDSLTRTKLTQSFWDDKSNDFWMDRSIDRSHSSWQHREMS